MNIRAIALGCYKVVDTNDFLLKEYDLQGSISQTNLVI